MNVQDELKVGDAVVKVRGYNFSGEIVSVFNTKTGKRRVVVEATSASGLLHIFSPEQVQRIER